MLNVSLSASPRNRGEVPITPGLTGSLGPSHTATMPRLLCTIPLCAALLSHAIPAVAHGATSGDSPVTSGSVVLRHRTAAEIVALLARAAAPTDLAETPRGARTGSGDALLPVGVDGILISGSAGLTILAPSERLADAAECIRLLDQPVTTLPSGRMRIAISLRRGDPRQGRREIVAVPGFGAVLVRGAEVVLEGDRIWLHAALRAVVRAEFHLASANADGEL